MTSFGVAGSAEAVQTSVGNHAVDLDLLFGGREIVEAHPSSTHQLTEEFLRLRAGIALSSWLKFDSLTLASNGGPTIKATRSGVYNWNDAFQENVLGVDFEEAYFDARFSSFDLRVGKQRIAWGKMDRFSPNDLLNTFSYLDPLLKEETERRIGAPAIQASYFPESTWLPSESRITGVWIPAFVPYRFGTAKCESSSGGRDCDVERWFPPAAVPPSTLSLPAGIIPLPGGGGSPKLSVPISFQTMNRAPPARRFDNGEIGLRYAALVRDADVSIYYYNGYDPSPAFKLTAEAIGQSDSDPANPIHVRDLRGETTLTPAFQRIQSGGADASYAFEHFTLRAEAAFIHDRPFARDLRTLIDDPRQLAPELAQALRGLAAGQGSVPVDLPDSFVTRNAVAWAAGCDGTFDGYWALLQLDQTDVLHNHVNLLIADVETRLLLNLRKSFLEDRLMVQLVAIHSIESDYSVLRPRLRYKLSDRFAVEAGYLFIAGRSASLIGQYGNNDEAWIGFDVSL